MKDLTWLVLSCLVYGRHLLVLTLGAEPPYLLCHVVLLSGFRAEGEQALLADSGACDLRANPPSSVLLHVEIWLWV